MKNQRTAFACKTCKGTLQVQDDRKLGEVILWRPNCNKLYRYSGPNEVETDRSVSMETVANILAALYLDEI